MKSFKIITALLAIAASAHSQSKVIDSEVIKTNDGTKTYIIARNLTIQPNGNQGVTFTSSSATYSFRLANPDGTYFAPSTNQNFVRTEKVLISGVTDETTVKTLPLTQKSTVYEYIDGLGRKLQNVAVRVSPSQSDVVTPFLYNDLGQTAFEYLPFVANGGGLFQSANEDGTTSFYKNPPAGVQADERPFKENLFEASPLNRVKEVFGAGNDWKANNKSVKSVTKLNQATEGIIRWQYFTGGIPVKDGTYPDNHLTVLETTDEGGQITKVYKNSRDQVVLHRVGDGTTWFDTHHLYSPSGLPTLVIQPEGVARLSTEFDAVGADQLSFLNRWCFQYQYDDEQRLVAKRTPGWTDWAYTIYDKWNRVVLTQTPAQRARNEWHFTKYDRFNRTIISGLHTSSSDRATLQLAVNNYYSTNPNNRYETESVDATGYTLSTTFPQSPAESALLQVNYYDNYNFVSYPQWDAETGSYSYTNIAGFPQWNTDPALSEIMTGVKGHATGAKTRVKDGASSRWLNMVTYYDKKYNAVQVIAENYVGGWNRVTSLFDFVGKNLKTQLYHTGTNTSLTTLREMEYDHAGRILKLYQTTDSGPRVLMASNKYNEIGQLIEKNIHSTDNGQSFLQSADMRYNIRGWLTSINNAQLTTDNNITNDDTNDLFGMELLYNPANPPILSGYTPTTNSTVPQLYNGNITAIKWKTDTRQPGIAPQERMYGFDYDVLNRLKKAYYATNNAGAWSGDVGLFNEGIKSYDKNGNIMGIDRQGKVDGASSAIDNTTYSYIYPAGGAIANFAGAGNRLLSISDAGSAAGFKDASAQVTEEFKYDASGNLIFDHNKSISNVYYNHLNLPEKIEFTTPSGAIDRLIYVYDAVGNKLRMEVYKNGTTGSNGTRVWTTEYDGEIQYDKGQNDATRMLTFAATPEGRVIRNGSGYDYEYFHKDHQGNVRLTYGAFKQTDSYRATMENPPAPSTLGAEESNIFKNVNNTTRHQDATFNFTQPGDRTLNPDRSAKTNGFLGLPIGPAKSLQLASGDKVKMEVYARYSQATGSTATVAASALITALATTTFGYASGETAYASMNANAPFIPGIGGASATVPKAYLAYLFFNTSYQYVSSGAVSITTGAFNAFEKLERTFTAPQDGYMYIYVANEANTSTSTVYFDEMLIVHQKNTSALQVTQASDYYPFGLAFNSYQAERITEGFAAQQKNRYGFQGQERQSDLGLGWSQFKWRMHDPATGRFVGVDPFAHKREWLSPYNFVQNNPLNRIDPDGAFDWVLNGDGEIYWDKNANSQATTKQGETYLGKDLNFTFNSYINNTFDGARPPWPVEGDKLTSTIKLTSNEDSNGNLLSVDVNSSYSIGETGGIGMFKGRDYFPGLGDNQNQSINLNDVRSFSATFEQHASVPGLEAAGLDMLGYDIVNVAQKFTLGLLGNRLSVSAATDIFPSATLSVNGNQLFQYNQPSFRGTHGRDSRTVFGDNGVGGSTITETVPRRPAPSFYNRYKK